MMKEKMNIKSYLIDIGSGVVLICLLLIIAALLTGIVYVISLNSQVPIIDTVGTSDGWLGYYGGVIGGLMTLIGVWWTITDQSHKRKEDNRRNYLPSFGFLNDEIENKMFKRGRDFLPPTFAPAQFVEFDHFQTRLVISNCGRGEAKNLIMYLNKPSTLICVNPDNNAHSKISKGLFEEMPVKIEAGYAPVNHKYYLIFYTLRDWAVKNNIIIEDNLILEYDDFQDNHYRQELIIRRHIRQDNPEYFDLRLFSKAPTIIKESEKLKSSVKIVNNSSELKKIVINSIVETLESCSYSKVKMFSTMLNDVFTSTIIMSDGESEIYEPEKYTKFLNDDNSDVKEENVTIRRKTKKSKKR